MIYSVNFGKPLDQHYFFNFHVKSEHAEFITKKLYDFLFFNLKK